jgi:prophage maintenance system killer protein
MDGNKRTAAQMLLLFLAREGVDLVPWGEEDVARKLEDLVVSVAAGCARFAEIERWLGPRLAPL